jgi:predicted dithiol-disulfide oxidoreductase (DUF899 family)
MEQGRINYPEIVSREEWRKARVRLLDMEKEATRRRDALNAERRRLPMVEIEKNYVFEGPEGEASLQDLFPGANAAHRLPFHVALGSRPAP